MQIVTLAAIYFIVWSVCLFAVLPWGARSQRDAGEVIPGSEAGAPALLRLWPKFLITTLLAAVVTALILWGLSNPILQEYFR